VNLPFIGLFAVWL